MTAKAVEICIDASQESSARSALTAAYMGGADRVEVCASMDVDGTTPPRQRIRLARDIFVDRPGVICMIRPRAGDFFYVGWQNKSGAQGDWGKKVTRDDAKRGPAR